jgi:uncharacterized membrane protein YfcA
MTQLEFAGLAATGSLLAGFLGALAGLGGGVVIVPMLALAFHVDVHYAIGASLISVIGTSAGAQAAQPAIRPAAPSAPAPRHQGFHGASFSNLRVGLFLEVATTIGAICGAFLSSSTPTRWIAILFGLVLLYSAVMSIRPKIDKPHPGPPDPLATRLRLNGTHPAELPALNASSKQPGSQPESAPVPYTARRVPLGFGLMFGAGALSGLLGIGSGAVKVLAMDEAMKLPFKVSTATSNFMIGVTAAASAGVYLSRGYIDPAIAMPVTLGVLVGSVAGAHVLARAQVHSVRTVFALVIALLGAEMIFNGITGGL